MAIQKPPGFNSLPPGFNSFEEFYCFRKQIADMTFRKQISDMIHVIGRRELEILHNEPRSVIFETAILSLRNYTEELQNLLQTYVKSGGS